MRCLFAVLALLIPVTFTAPAAGASERVVVFAAASLKTALDAVAAEFEAATGHDVVISYAGSNALAQQIIAGAPADLFLSAADNWMDAVEAAGLILPGTRRDMLGNRLVVVAHGADAPPLDRIADLPARLGDGKLAMALVDAVPAGQYGKAALTTLGLWDRLAPAVAQSDNVRAALTLVAAGEAPLGIVYASDAVATPDVTVVYTFAADSHPPIVYPVARLAGADTAASRAFYAALQADAADAHFAAQGFVIPE